MNCSAGSIKETEESLNLLSKKQKTRKTKKITRRNSIMTLLIQITLAAALILSIIVPFGVYLVGERNEGRYKKTIGVNAFFFFGTMIIAATVMLVGKVNVQIGRASCREECEMCRA